MLSIVISLLAAVVTFVATLSRFDKFSAIFLAPVVGIGVYVLLGRRVRKRAEVISAEVEGHIKGQRYEKAIQSLETLRPLGRWQPMLTASTDGQIGMLKFAYLKDFEGARPHLEKAHRWLWQASAMLAAGHFKKRRYDEMDKVFERAVTYNKKQALLWATYAWCEYKRGQNDQALQILGRAREALPADERLKNQQLGLQNGKKLKMQAFGAEWLAFHLDDHPAAAASPPGGARGQRYTPPMHIMGGMRGGKRGLPRQ